MDGPASNAFIINILFLNNRKILDRFFFYIRQMKKNRRAQMVDIEKKKNRIHVIQNILIYHITLRI